jgi:hypothetical protein
LGDEQCKRKKVKEIGRNFAIPLIGQARVLNIDVYAVQVKELKRKKHNSWLKREDLAQKKPGNVQDLLPLTM